MARRNVRTTAAQTEAANEETPVSETATEPEAQPAVEVTSDAPAPDAPADSETSPAETPAETSADATPLTGDAPADGADAPAETPSTDGSEAPKEADPVADLMKFVDDLMESEDRDRQTGTLPEAQVSKFGEMFRALDPVQKRQARREFTEKIQVCLDDEDDETTYDSVVKAKSLNYLVNETKKGTAAKSGATTAAKVDPTEAYVDSFLSIALATIALDVPSGVDEAKARESIAKLAGAYQDATTPEGMKFREYVTWARNTDTEKRGDEPEVPEYAKRAVKIADGKAAGSRRGRAASAGGAGRTRVPSGGQKDIAKHVAEALADVPVGQFVSIATIANFKSVEYGPDRSPSAGAISARLFPPNGGPSTIPNVEGVTAEDSPENKKGARKTA